MSRRLLCKRLRHHLDHNHVTLNLGKAFRLRVHGNSSSALVTQRRHAMLIRVQPVLIGRVCAKRVFDISHRQRKRVQQALSLFCRAVGVVVECVAVTVGLFDAKRQTGLSILGSLQQVGHDRSVFGQQHGHTRDVTILDAKVGANGHTKKVLLAVGVKGVNRLLHDRHLIISQITAQKRCVEITVRHRFVGLQCSIICRANKFIRLDFNAV